MKAFIWSKEWVFRVFLLMFLWISQGSFAVVNGQGFVFQHFTEKEGLPSTYLYGILQDKQGFIWMTGESGVVWYDGKKYSVPDIEGELQDEIINFFSGSTNRVWMQDLSGRILAYEDGKVFNFPEIGLSEVYKYTEVYNHPNGEFWISNKEDVFIYKPGKDSLSSLHVDNSKNKLVSVKAFGETGDGRTILLNRYGYHLFDNNENSFTTYKSGEIVNDFSFGFRKEGRPYIVKDNEVFYFNLETGLFEKRLEQFNDFFKSGLLDAFEDSDGDVWFSTRDGLLYLDIKPNGELEMSRFLEGNLMGGIMEDKERNLWFVTGQNGVFMLASKKINIFNKIDEGKPLRFVKENLDGNIVLGFDNNQFKVLNKSFEIVHEQKINEQTNRLYDLAVDKNGDHYFITSGGYVQYDKDFKLKNKFSIGSPKSGSFGKDGKLWLAAGEYFGLMKESGVIEKIFEKRCYSVFPDEEKVWIGSIDGLFFYEENEVINQGGDKLNFDIRDIERLENGNLLLATQKSGVFCYQPSSDSIIHHFSTKTGLSSNNCTKVIFDDQFLWIATKKGINRVRQSDYSVSIIGVDQGLPSNEINDLYQSDGKIYVATNRGLAVFNEDIDLNRMPPSLQLLNIKIDERDTTFHEKYVLDYANNNIKIEFAAITFKDADRSIFQYKMEGIDETWVESSVDIAQYPSLPSGDYTFRVKTKTTNSDWSDEQIVKFFIKTPFWNTWWFYTMIGLFISGISYLIFREREKRKNVIKDMKVSQLTALRAQMNPHFVFNAMNSIQEFIVDKDTRSANRYLSQFARLMRNILNVSDKNRISLSKEIESLNLYLSLESLRFGDSFEYILEVGEEIDKDMIYLPAMLIQPFVENAVKHGLMHRKGDKKLYLRFFIEDEKLICEVEDNGVGRKKSSEIRRLNPKIYPSKATGITYERIKLFNSIYKDALNAEVIDLKNKSNEFEGTKVRLSISTNFKG